MSREVLYILHLPLVLIFVLNRADWFVRFMDELKQSKYDEAERKHIAFF